MTATSFGLAQIFDQLGVEGLLSPDQRLAIDQRKDSSSPQDTGINWIFSIMTTVGAWISAVLFIGFLGLSRLIVYESLTSFVLWGLIFVAMAVFFSRNQDQLFLRQLGLALSTAGHLLILIRIGFNHNGLPWVVLISALLAGVLYPLIRQFTHRFLSILLFIILLSIWIVFDWRNLTGFYLLITLQAGVLVSLYLPREPRWISPSLTYTLAIGLALSQSLSLLPLDYIDHWIIPWIPMRILIGAWLLVITYRTLMLSQTEKGWPFVLSLAAVGALIPLSTPGLLVSLGLMIMGHARQSQMIRLIGFVSFALYLFFFYYSLTMPLDHKSYLLMGTGLVLLLGRAMMRRYKVFVGRKA